MKWFRRSDVEVGGGGVALGLGQWLCVTALTGIVFRVLKHSGYASLHIAIREVRVQGSGYSSLH
jgi:hypothetical protein